MTLPCIRVCVLFIVFACYAGVASGKKPSEEQVCAYGQRATLPYDEKGLVIRAFIKSQRAKERIVICYGYLKRIPIARSFKISPEASKKFRGIRVIEFNAWLYAEAPIPVLLGITAHELSHYGFAQDGYCSWLHDHEGAHAYARCELAVDRRAVLLIGPCITYTTLRFVHKYVGALLLYESLSDLEERIEWFEKNTHCVEWQEY